MYSFRHISPLDLPLFCLALYLHLYHALKALLEALGAPLSAGFLGDVERWRQGADHNLGDAFALLGMTLAELALGLADYFHDRPHVLLVLVGSSILAAHEATRALRRPRGPRLPDERLRPSGRAESPRRPAAPPRS